MRFKLIILLIISFVFVAFGCRSKSHNPVSNSISQSQYVEVKHAKGFSISTSSNGFNLSILNPWQGAQNENQSFCFSYANSKISDSCINLPLKRIVCLSTTHLAFLSSLGELERVVGVSGGKYISNQFILSRIRKGEVVDLGYEQSLNYELLLSIKPDVVFAYGIGSESLGYLNRIRELGVKVVIIGEYLESTPLAKAEWIKVFGAMLGKSSVADSIFSRIESEYVAVSNRFRNRPVKPKVFINLPWNDVWYFPGNENYMASLISDAGGDYLLSNLKGNETHAFSFESAIEKGVNADVWINLGSYNSVKQVLGDFPRLKVLPVIKSENVFNNNKRITAEGGNDIFESGVMNPHIILKDLVKIFYPDSIEHSLFYYKKL